MTFCLLSRTTSHFPKDTSIKIENFSPSVRHTWVKKNYLFSSYHSICDVICYVIPTQSNYPKLSSNYHFIWSFESTLAKNKCLALSAKTDLCLHC